MDDEHLVVNIGKLELQEGDTLVVSMDYRLSEEAKERLTNAVKKLLAEMKLVNVGIVILDGGVKLSVLRKKEV